MKHAIVIPVLLFSFLSAFAQQQSKTMLEIVKEKNTGIKLNNSRHSCWPEEFDIKKVVIPKARLRNITPKGKIYGLPLDNMPCLVSEKTSEMPTAQQNSEAVAIPNALKIQSLIPQNLNRPSAFKDREFLSILYDINYSCWRPKPVTNSTPAVSVIKPSSAK